MLWKCLLQAPRIFLNFFYVEAKTTAKLLFIFVLHFACVAFRRGVYFFFVSVAGKSRLHLTNARLNTPFCCCWFACLLHFTRHSLPLSFFMCTLLSLLLCAAFTYICFCCCRNIKRHQHIIRLWVRTEIIFIVNQQQHQQQTAPNLLLQMSALSSNATTAAARCGAGCVWQICMGRCKPT